MAMCLRIHQAASYIVLQFKNIYHALLWKMVEWQRHFNRLLHPLESALTDGYLL